MSPVSLGQEVFFLLVFGFLYNVVRFFAAGENKEKRTHYRTVLFWAAMAVLLDTVLLSR